MKKMVILLLACIFLSQIGFAYDAVIVVGGGMSSPNNLPVGGYKPVLKIYSGETTTGQPIYDSGTRYNSKLFSHAVGNFPYCDRPLAGTAQAPLITEVITSFQTTVLSLTSGNKYSLKLEFEALCTLGKWYNIIWEDGGCWGECTALSEDYNNYKKSTCFQQTSSCPFNYCVLSLSKDVPCDGQRSNRNNPVAATLNSPAGGGAKATFGDDPTITFTAP